MFLDMLTIAKELDMKITGIIHVGAHLGEEAPTYEALGVKNVYWVEANPEVMPKLIQAVFPYGHSVINSLVTDERQKVYSFNVTNYDGMSSSIYQWGTHTQFSPDTVVEKTLQLWSTTLDMLVFENGIEDVNMLNIDVEGANLDVLKGATDLLPSIDYIYLEIQTENVYDGAPLLGEVHEWLRERGFTRKAIHMVEGQGWGDALWVRR